MKLSAQALKAANPHLGFQDDGDGWVTVRDVASIDGELLSWDDPRYRAARVYAETGIRSTEQVDDYGWFVGMCANFAALKIVAPIAVLHAATDDGPGSFETKLINAFTYLPRWFSTHT